MTIKLLHPASRYDQTEAIIAKTRDKIRLAKGPQAKRLRDYLQLMLWARRVMEQERTWRV